MTVTNIKAIVGNPGTGKTYTLVRRANEYFDNDEDVFIVTPTHAAENNIRKAFRKMFIEGGMTQEGYNRSKESIHVLNHYKNYLSPHILLDESAMFGMENFYSILQKANNRTFDVDIELYGDLLQLEPVHGDSVLRSIIDFNRDKSDKKTIWDYAKESLYSKVENKLILVPEEFDIELKSIELIVLKQNHRLESQNFSGYNNDYYDYLIDNVVYSDDYSGYLKYAIENYYLITTPTNARGDEINRLLTKEYNNAFKVAPFVFDDVEGKYYLNPFHKHYEELKEHFDFMPEIDKNEAGKYKATAYMNVHRVQSFTVDNVLFYMGNNAIGNRHKKHYSNNMLYTSVTRARHDVQLLGLTESFEQMRETMPQSAQEKNLHRRANRAMLNLRQWIEEIDYIPTAEEVLDRYKVLYNDDSILSFSDKNIITINKVVSKSYTDRYIINYINNEFTDKFGFTLTLWLKNNSANAKKSPRKGKVKQWIDSLSDDELEVVKQDVEELSKANFREKYNKDRNNVRELLGWKLRTYDYSYVSLNFRLGCKKTKRINRVVHFDNLHFEISRG